MSRSTERGWRRWTAQLVCAALLVQTSGAPALAELPRATAGELVPLGGSSQAEPGTFSWGLENARAMVGAAVRGASGGWRAAAGWLGGVRAAVALASLGVAQDGEPPAAETPEVDPSLVVDQVGTEEEPPPDLGGPPIPPGVASLAPRGQPAAALARVKALQPGEVGFLPGFNLASLPNAPPDPSPAAVLAPLAGQYTKVFAYDNCDPSDSWKVFDPADPAGSDLTSLDETQGFWIDATAAAVLPASGSQPAATSIPLCTGWNLIGYPLAQPRAPLSALASIADAVVRVYGFDAADPADPWEVFDPAVPFWASDLGAMRPGYGYWVLVSRDVTLEYANSGPPPEVEIAGPLDLGEVTTSTDVVGTVRSSLLERWSLGVRPSGEEGDFAELASGTAPVSGTLAAFDPTLLLNGLYDLRLEARDVQGQVVEETIAVAVDGQQKIGNFTVSFSDLAVPLAGLDLEVVRTYDSRDKAQHDFGIGWRLDVRQGSYRNNRPPGDGWQIRDGFLPCQAALESKSHLTTVRLSDVEVYRFALTLASPASTGGGCFAEAGFVFVDGPLPGSTLEILGNTTVFYANGANEVVDADSFALYEPQAVRLTTRDGRIFDVDLDAGVTHVEDLNGNALEITAAGITHSSGVSIDFERDAVGRITAITEPRGERVSYAYDAAGDLVAATDRGGHTTRFTYDGNHGLLAIEDPLGRTPLRNEYDAAGRLVRSTDASGKTIDLTHDLGANTEIVTNRLGQQRLLEYGPRGNVVREVDELGQETLRTFDGRDNLLSETDPLGHATTRSYSANNDLLSMTDPLGNTTTFTYDSRGRVLTTTDARGNVTTNAYDAAGNLTSTTDALGNTTTFTYDARGNLRSETDALGNVRTFEVDARGNVTRETDALGNETVSTYDAGGNRLTETRTRTLGDGSTETLPTTFAYDALGRLTSTTDPLGHTTTTVYDALGRTLSTADALGRATGFAYDGLGRLVETTHPDGTHELQSYDAEGRLLTQTDRGGRVTSFTYDAAGRLTETQAADGAVTRSGYDDAGRLVSSTDARGNTTTFEYDAAGRRTKVTDPLGNETTFIYDEAGNQTAVTDARGATTTFAYDALNRLTTTTFPDGTTQEVAYDELGRRVAETDPAGRVTQFAYDPLGRLTGVTDALGQVTSYGYDELGNRVSQTDANGHTTTFGYDALGRQTSRTLPAVGEPPITVTERMAYDAVGNMVSRTKLDGATLAFTYDAANRMTRKSFPDGSAVLFTYTATGRRSTVDDARGTTSYSYEERDRLIGLTYPDGRALFYDYDPQGNRTGLTAQIGETALATTYGYDALNRLATVTDPDGRAYTHSYDPNGNRAAVSYPNGVTTSYQYDALNRLKDLTTRTSVGEVIQSYAYTLGPAGNRTAIVEADGRTAAYTYDPLYRLTGERVTDASDALVYENTFTYDPVGNRLEQDQTASDGTTTPISSTYDERDRILTQDGTTFSWDANGNLTAKSGSDGATYRWDYEDRLVQVELADGTLVDHTYDTDGVRVRTAVTPAGGGATAVTDYLTDTSGPLSQVVAETDGAGALTAYYVRGDDLLAVLRGGTVRYYHADGLGSIRRLTDGDGVVTDRYAFAAFGELLTHEGSDPNAYLFAGEARDSDSGFYYNRARWMDPGFGAFASEDAWPSVPTRPKSLQRYSYTHSNPVNRVDPTGFEESLASFSAAFAASSYIDSLGSIAVRIASQQLGRTAARLLIRGALAFGGAYIANAIYLSVVGTEELARARDETRVRIEDLARAKSERILFHYTSQASALQIAEDGAIVASSKKFFGGFTFPPGAYATDVPPWEASLTQRALSAYFFGGNEGRDVSWYVAIAALPDFLGPLPFPGLGNQYYRPAPEGFPVPVIVLHVGPNLMIP